MSAEDVISRLDGTQRTGAVTWIAKCPAHDDRSPSLSVKDAGEGRTLINCFAGCSVQVVLDALGLTWSALYPPRSNDPYARRKFTKAGWHSAADALRCLDTEATIIYFAARDMCDGITLSEQDRDRLLIAVARVKRAREVCCG